MVSATDELPSQLEAHFMEWKMLGVVIWFEIGLGPIT